LNDYSFESERLSRVRDLFCFASFTGLRFSDLKELNREHHRENAIVKNHKKTQKIISTSLNEFAKEILSKYSDEPYLLPRISHDKANEYIKECFRVIAKTQPEKEGFNRLVTKKSVIGNVVEEEVKPLHEAITFHIARKTFITNSIMLGVNIKVLQDMGAPLREKDLRKYLKINDAFKSKVMDETWNKIR
jgi:integrase